MNIYVIMLTLPHRQRWPWEYSTQVIDVEGREMNVKLKTIQAAMRAAATRGVDPRDSHSVQAEMLQRHWKMESGRRSTAVEPREAPREEFQERSSEADANRYLSILLQRQAG